MSGVLQDHPRKVAGGLAAVLALAVPVIMAWEGTRQVGYADVIGVATSCTGHTGPDAVVGRHYTKAECESQLAHDLQRTAAGIAPCIHVPVPDESAAAFVSFAFNAGVRAFCGSRLAAKLNAGDLRGACAELSRWDRAGRPLRQIKGLTRRRAAERGLCERGLR